MTQFLEDDLNTRNKNYVVDDTLRNLPCVVLDFQFLGCDHLKCYFKIFIEVL